MKADSTLITEVKAGQRSSFSELVRRHQKVMMRVALRITRNIDLAEDVVQESFLKAYQKLDRFEGRSSFRSWLYQITANTAKNKLRSLKRESVDIDNVSLAHKERAESMLLYSSLQELIREEVEKLPEKQRMALSLRIFDDLSFKEIAELMDCPYDTAKANYRHALLKLRSRIGNNEEFKDWNEWIVPVGKSSHGIYAEVEP